VKITEQRPKVRDLVRDASEIDYDFLADLWSLENQKVYSETERAIIESAVVMADAWNLRAARYAMLSLGGRLFGFVAMLKLAEEAATSEMDRKATP
jgi:hypothetical protein